MYIIYLYIIYILFISLVRRFKNSSSNGPAACMLRPYCYLLFVICYDCARKGLPRRGRSDMCYDLIVICYLLFVMIVPATHGNARPVEREKCFTVFCDFTAIARRFHRNRAAIVCQSPFPMFHAACRLITPTRGNEGASLQ